MSVRLYDMIKTSIMKELDVILLKIAHALYLIQTVIQKYITFSL